VQRGEEFVVKKGGDEGEEKQAQRGGPIVRPENGFQIVEGRSLGDVGINAIIRVARRKNLSHYQSRPEKGEKAGIKKVRETPPDEGGD